MKVVGKKVVGRRCALCVSAAASGRPGPLFTEADLTLCSPSPTPHAVMASRHDPGAWAVLSALWCVSLLVSVNFTHLPVHLQNTRTQRYGDVDHLGHHCCAAVAGARSGHSDGVGGEKSRARVTA
jgi:hypothetical protein